MFEQHSYINWKRKVVKINSSEISANCIETSAIDTIFVRFHDNQLLHIVCDV